MDIKLYEIGAALLGIPHERQQVDLEQARRIAGSKELHATLPFEKIVQFALCSEDYLYFSSSGRSSAKESTLFRSVYRECFRSTETAVTNESTSFSQALL